MVGIRFNSPWIDATERRARDLFESLAHGNWDALDKQTKDMYFRAVADLERDIRPVYVGLRLQDFANGLFVPYWCEVWDQDGKHTVFDLRLEKHSGIYIKDGRKYAGVRSVHLYIYENENITKAVRIETNDFKDVWISKDRLSSEPELDWLRKLYREANDYMKHFNQKPE